MNGRCRKQKRVSEVQKTQKKGNKKLLHTQTYVDIYVHMNKKTNTIKIIGKR